MKVELIIDEKITKPHILIYTNEITDYLTYLMNIIKTGDIVIPATYENKIHILKPKDIYLIKVVDNKLEIYDKNKIYFLNKRLYEVKDVLGPNFIRISKGSILNIDYVESVESSFNGVLKVKLKNNQTDYISRLYVKAFKKQLGL